MWEMDFYPGTRITTTLAATVTATTTGTLHVPLVNHAYVNWGSGQQDFGFTTTVLAAVPEFALSYKPDPPDANTGDVITYTIVAMNSGDSVTDVLLSNILPNGVAFVPGSCTYIVVPPGSASLIIPCNDLVPGQEQTVWEQDMPRGALITTTFRVTVTAPEGSMRWPLQNCASLGWSVIQEEICDTSLANPTVYVYMPLIVRNYKRDTFEPNGTPAQAYGPLTSGKVYRSFIWDALDLNDYYYIVPLTNTVDVHVELTNIPVGSDYDLYIYYCTSSACPFVVRSAQEGNVDESVDFTPTPNETYYIGIRYWDGIYNDEQPYHLVATYQ